MKSYLQVFLLFAGNYLLTSCDPSCRLVIKNLTRHTITASAIYYARPDTVQTFAIKPGSTTIDYLGFGGWGDRRTRQYARIYKKLQFITATDTLRFADSTQVYQFLSRQPTKGFGRSTRIIELK